MAKMRIYASNSTILDSEHPDTNYNSATTRSPGAGELLVKFAPTAANLATLEGKYITSVCVGVYTTSTYHAMHIITYLLDQDYDFSTLTYNNIGKYPGEWLSLETVPEYLETGAGYKYVYIEELRDNLENLRKILTYGARIDTLGTMMTAKGSNKPYIEINYEAATPYYNLSTGKRVLASEISNTVTWYWYWAYKIWGETPTVASQKLKWRISSSYPENVIELAASAKSVKIPERTFPAQDIELAVVGTTSNGETSKEKWEKQAIYAPEMSGVAPTMDAVCPKNSPTVMTWTIQQFESLDNGSTPTVRYVPVEQTSATISWRKTGSTTATTINITGDIKSHTLPAGTFSADSVEWMVSATTLSGITVSSNWTPLSTVDTKPTARTVSPVGIVIDATVINRFEWEHIIETGTQQSKADLQKSDDGTTWYSLATVSGSDLYYDVLADTFSSGTKYWRVRTYNTDSTPSDWSGRAEFIAINSPSTPAITVKSTGGRPSITWQSTEQEAYQLTLSDGYATGTVFGTAKEWRSPRYLADGTYTVRVRVQNQYGLWSEWGGATLPVTHAEGEAIDLFATVGSEALLRWATNGSYDFYIVERDGVAIAKTTDQTYTDKTSIGTVTYQVRGCYADSYDYGLSTSRTVTVRPDTNVICDLEGGGDWLEMRLSETQMRANNCNRASGIAVIHLAGLAYPVEERSETRDLTMTVSVAWPHKQADQARALELLVGKMVCVKDRYGSMAIGTLSSLECNADAAMLRYALTIQHTNREEAINLDS